MPSDLHVQILRNALGRAFPGCPFEEIEAALPKLSYRALVPGEVLIQMHDLAGQAFVLLEGLLQVYGRNSDARLTPIAAIAVPGRLFGEQALLPGHRYRNADVLALEASTVAEVPEEVFHHLIQSDPEALQHLQELGAWELEQRLHALGIGLDLHLGEGRLWKSEQADAGAVLIEPDQVPSQALFVVNGQVAVRSPEQGDPVMLLGSGALIGADACCGGHAFGHTLMAESQLDFIWVPRSHLRIDLGERSAERSLDAMRFLPGFGLVQRHRTVLDGQPCWITDYTQLPQGPVRVIQRSIAGRIEATRRLATDASLITELSPDGTNQLVVNAMGQLQAIAVRQDWDLLEPVIGLMLRGDSLDDLQRQAFRNTGRFWLESADQKVAQSLQIVCGCTGTTAAQLRQAANGSHALVDVQRRTGAGLVCGGCSSRLSLVLEQKPDGRLCRIQRRDLVPGCLEVALIRIDQAPLPPWRLGQHVLVEAMLEGRWVGRSYTLIDGDQDRYTLAVKQLRGGVLSNWLAAATRWDLVRVSSPLGAVTPDPEDPRPLLYVVAGIGVTPALAALRQRPIRRRLVIAYAYRGESSAVGLDALREAAAQGVIELVTHDSESNGRLDPQLWIERLKGWLAKPVELILCGPEAFNRRVGSCLEAWNGCEVKVERFINAVDGQPAASEPGSWRRRQQVLPAAAPCPYPRSASPSPLDEAKAFLAIHHGEIDPCGDLPKRLSAVAREIDITGQWQPTSAELQFAARLAWRQAERCVGRLYWQGLELFDRRALADPAEMAEALFDHLRFAFNGGDLRPAISVFAPGDLESKPARIWNPQLLRYAGYRSASGRQIGDPAQNALTARIRELGWEPKGGAFELLPLVIETERDGPCLFELPGDCREEVLIRHPRHAWIESLGLRWHAVPAVSDLALDVGGCCFPMAPFNGWYVDTEIAARNLSDVNRYNLLPSIGEGLGLNLHDDRSLWRDHAQLVLAEAVLYSFDQRGVKMSDHHTIGHEFLTFCQQELSVGREPQAEWSWVVPPMSGSLNVLYQEPFENKAYKPAYVPQPPAWSTASRSPSAPTASTPVDEPPRRCPFSR